LIVVDLCSRELFDKLHIRTGISVDWIRLSVDGPPSTTQMDAGVDRAFRFRRMWTLVVYDQDSTEGSSGILDAFVAWLRSEHICPCFVQKLLGGIDAFAESYPFLVTGHPRYSNAEYPSEIVPNFMYLGSWVTANSLRILQDLQVTRVINATDVCDMPFKAEMNYLHCPLDDNPKADIQQFFDQAMLFLKDAQAKHERVLIHCQMGMSRSSTLAVLWVMLEQNVSLKDAVHMVRLCRPFINPNPGFLLQLQRMEMTVRGQASIRFPPDEVITVKIAYDWLQEDGSWVPRAVLTSPD
jgi:protein-tyrosine phosphatase